MQDSLARILASLDPALGSMEAAAAYTAKSSASLTWYDLNSSSWKTHQQSLFADSGPFLETWPSAGSMLGGQSWPLLMWVRPINANDGGALHGVPTPLANDAEKRGEFDPDRSWGCAGFARKFPTPTTMDTGSRFNRSPSKGAAMRPTLGAMAKFDLWATPQAHDATKGNAKRVGRFGTKAGGRNLTDEVQMWPTPTATLASKGGRVTPRKAREGHSLIEAVSARTTWPSPAARDWRSGKGRTENGHTPQLPEVVGGQLNPMWVAWLMGWPLDHTKSKHWVTGKSPSKKPQLGESLEGQ